MKKHGNVPPRGCVSVCGWVRGVGGFFFGCGRSGEVVGEGNDVHGKLLCGEANWGVGRGAVGDDDCMGICIEEIKGELVDGVGGIDRSGGQGGGDDGEVSDGEIGSVRKNEGNNGGWGDGGDEMVGERGDAMTKGIVRENLTSCR